MTIYQIGEEHSSMGELRKSLIKFPQFTLLIAKYPSKMLENK